MSEERRKEIAKDAREKGEKTKVTIRDVRRKANDHVKKAESLMVKLPKMILKEMKNLSRN